MATKVRIRVKSDRHDFQKAYDDWSTSVGGGDMIVVGPGDDIYQVDERSLPDLKVAGIDFELV
jgi:hypothetical protein